MGYNVVLDTMSVDGALKTWSEELRELLKQAGIPILMRKFQACKSKGRFGILLENRNVIKRQEAPAAKINSKSMRCEEVCT